MRIPAWWGPWNGTAASVPSPATTPGSGVSSPFCGSAIADARVVSVLDVPAAPAALVSASVARAAPISPAPAD
ncbi:MAG TPA: hypothetical protein VGG23_10820 [Acidimicrobiales bacterium]